MLLMTNAIIVHGKPTQERYENPDEPKPHEANWLPWLGEKLAESGIEVSIPIMPKPYYPVYEDWQNTFEKHHIDSQTALVGHSAGAEFLLRWLAENGGQTAEQLVLVAPYRDFDMKYGDFSNYRLDRKVIERVGSVTIFNSTDDDLTINRRTDELLGVVEGAELIEFKDHGHFRIGHNMDTREFPKLLEVLSN